MSLDPSRKRFLHGMLGFGAFGALAHGNAAAAAASTNKDDGRAVAFGLRRQRGGSA